MAASTFSRGTPCLRMSLVDCGAERRKRVGEFGEAIELRAVAHFAEFRVVAVLLAAARIAAGGLHVALAEAANPDVCPGRRNGERADALQRLLIAHRFAVRVAVGEALAGALA